MQSPGQPLARAAAGAGQVDQGSCESTASQLECLDVAPSHATRYRENVNKGIHSPVPLIPQSSHSSPSVLQAPWSK